MFEDLTRVRLVVNIKTLYVSILAVGSMIICREYGIEGSFPLTLISTAIIFPIVFSIGGAYKRRENALAHYGAIKAHGRAIFYAVRDWMPESDRDSLSQTQGVMRELMVGMRELFTNPEEEMREHETAVYSAFSKLSLLIRVELRDKGLPGGECSRLYAYMSKMMVAFENTKHIFQYRTPRSLRAYSDFFILVLPIMYGPYFVASSTSYSMYLEYLMPLLFTFILVGLDNIQEHLENPFDQIGVDDVAINAETFVKSLEH
ncbi:MAG: hypothetical protein CND85_00425 [Marine Group II euryarchaeote MED-G33]|nr:MAG: hypothetical protein CND85_00425 [Marine Group II euryarchaeote MED-G33]